MRILKLDENTKKNLLEDLLKRSPNQYTEYEERVAAILNAVKLQKDQALFDFTKKFQGRTDGNCRIMPDFPCESGCGVAETALP